MSNSERLAAAASTAKQKEYARDFLQSWKGHITWADAPMLEPVELPGVFVIEEEDVLAYNRAMGETDPLMVDPKYAREHAPNGTVLVHPVFTTTIGFWFAKPGTPMSWIRTPGARNPFQQATIHRRLMVGDRITMTSQNSDRFVRRGKHYITTHGVMRDANKETRAEVWATLILPAGRTEAERFATL
jgi:acyl dehydratase